jgi:hypothetical protein
MTQLLQCRLGNFPFDLRPVSLRQLPARLADAGLKDAVVREQQQAFGIEVQAAGRVHAGLVDKGGEGDLVALGTELAHDLIGLVEQQQAGRGAGHGGSNSRKTG